MRKGTKLGIGVTIVLVAAGVSALTAASRGRSALQVRIEPVQHRDLVAIVSASGWVRPHRKVDVQADIMGRVTDLRVKEGQAVKQGQVLLVIDPTQYEAALERAKAAVSEARAREAQAQANQIQAQRALVRQQALAAQDSNLVSQQSLEEAATGVQVQAELLKAARYSVAQAEASVGVAQDQLAKTVIRAPMDGVITRLNVDQGETAIVGTMNNPGSLLLTVADLAIMEAVVRVDETDLPQLQLGDSASIKIDAFPRRTFIGRVTEIGHSAIVSPETQAASGQAGQGQAVDFEVVITLDNPPAGLRSDLSTTADIVTAKRQNALAIPIIALTVRELGNVRPLPQETPEAQQAANQVSQDERNKDTEGVFVVRDGKAEFVPVQVGIAGREYFEVLSGLTEKDSVVAGPYDAIRNLVNGKAVRRLPVADTSRAKPVAEGT